MLFSENYISKFVTSLDYVIAIKQRELLQKLVSTGLDEVAAQAKVQEYFTLAKNNGNIVDWILQREQEGLNLQQIQKFLDWYGRNKANLPVEKRDIFQIDTNYINELQTKQETDTQQEQQAKSAISEVYNDGTYSVVKADTPEAIVEVANCEGKGANAWCIKGIDYAQSYGPPAFFIKTNGKLIVAVVPHKGEIRNLVNEAPSKVYY
jgi:DNA-binding transcriptional MerR regulator